MSNTRLASSARCLRTLTWRSLVSTASLAAALAVWPNAGASAQESIAEANSNPAPVQTADENNEVDEVVVYAQRRETLLQETPIAISVVDAEQLEAQSVRNVSQVVNQVPNVAQTSGPTGGNDAFFFIRGIGQVDSNPAGDPGVGVYIDEVYLGRVQGSSLDTLDIAQIEVLRGPQGTLYGRNTIGGAVNVITQDPGDVFGGRVRLTTGSRDRAEALVSVDVPFTPELKGKFSAFYRKQDGWGENVYTGDTFGDVENYGGRLKLVWDVTPDLEVRFAADMTRGDGSSAHTVLAGFNPMAGQIPGTTPLGVPFPADLLKDTSDNLFQNFSSIEPINELESNGASLQVRYDFGGIGFKSITAWRSVSQFVTNDFDGTGYTFYDNFFDTDQEQWSQEFQLSGALFNDSVNWLTGVYYYTEDVTHNNAICLGTNNGLPPPALAFERFTGECLQNNQLFSLDIESWAAFAHVDWQVTDRLGISLGARHTHEEKSQDYDFFIDNTAGVFSFFGFPPIVIPTIDASVSDSWSKFTPKVGIDYKLAENVFIYANYAQGFKSGGFDGRPIPGAPIRSYSPEEIATYEVGVKSDWADRRLILNAAAFHSEYTDIQLLVIDPASGFFVLTNAGDSDINGVELEAVLEPVDNFRVRLGAGWMKDEYQRLAPGAAFAGIDFGDSLPLTPDFTGSIGAEYTIDFGGGELTLRGDYNYRSDVAYGAPNGPLEMEEGFGLLDLRATASFGRDNNYALSLFGRNVTDETYISNAQDVRGALGVAFWQIGPPREFGVELSARF